MVRFKSLEIYRVEIRSREGFNRVSDGCSDEFVVGIDLVVVWFFRLFFSFLSYFPMYLRHCDPRMNISSAFFAKGSLFQTQIISKRFIKTKK